MIKWIFFDVGSTLVDETDCEEYRIEEGLKDNNVITPTTFRMLLKKLSSENKDAYNIIINKYGIKKIPWPSFKEKEIEGVEDVLKHFSIYFNLGVIANQPIGTKDRLEKLNIAKYFKVIISSAEEKLSKPNPEIFKLALQRANCKAEEAMMVGDRLDNDILPAMNLGFKTVWIKRSYGGYGNPNLLPKKIDYIFDDINEMVNIDLLELTTYQKINSKTIDDWNAQGWEWGKPISSKTYQDALNGKYEILLTPNKYMPHEWLGDIKGKKVLGLASGGAQQMPILAALGAKCTVLDYSQSQLDSELKMAKQEGYEIDIIKADMSKPLPFEDESFDLIINPVSMCYIQDVLSVFKECYRILKKGGRFITGQDNGINYAFDEKEDVVRYTLPFNPLINKDQLDSILKDDCGIQFSHTLEETIGGQIKAGFKILDIYDDTNSEGNLKEHNVASFFATLAIKE